MFNILPEGDEKISLMLGVIDGAMHEAIKGAGEDEVKLRRIITTITQDLCINIAENSETKDKANSMMGFVVYLVSKFATNEKFKSFMDAKESKVETEANNILKKVMGK